MAFDVHNDDIFEGCPVEKWLEILFHSNRTLAEGELRRILESLALCEQMLDELNPQWEKEFEKRKFAQTEQTNARLSSLAIESMGKILTQSE